MKKVSIYIGVVVLLLAAIFVINNKSKDDNESQIVETSLNKDFVADKDYNIDEDLDIPKVIFVYSDPTEHHPQG